MVPTLDRAVEACEIVEALKPFGVTQVPSASPQSADNVRYVYRTSSNGHTVRNPPGWLYGL